MGNPAQQIPAVAASVGFVSSCDGTRRAPFSLESDEVRELASGLPEGEEE